jgi:hypothetical protein
MSNIRSNTRRNPSNAVLFTRLSLIFEKGSLDQLKSFLKKNEINRLKNDDKIFAITYSKNNKAFKNVDNNELIDLLWSQRALKSRSRKTRKMRKNKMLK